MMVTGSVFGYGPFINARRFLRGGGGGQKSLILLNKKTTKGEVGGS